MLGVEEYKIRWGGLNMSAVPFVFRTAQPTSTNNELPSRDLCTGDDPLPAVLKTNAAGCVLSRTTILTEVDVETTDED